ncbi:hypothetical protein AB0F81_47490 [Actinoplanes sp. NPDC024001]|uniref:hypothetical protein n=1 Tax=Actinoplanes sp. NPDC024001 TaxID=3154598 RepID=UPI0033C1B413
MGLLGVPDNPLVKVFSGRAISRRVAGIVENWRRQALLWRSQLDSADSKAIWQVLRVAWRLDTDPTRLEVRPRGRHGRRHLRVIALAARCPPGHPATS